MERTIRALGAGMAIALVVVGGIAEAGWRHWGSGGGSHGSSGGSYGSSGGSYGSSGGSHGSSGGSYGSSGGSYGSSGGSHGSSGGYGWHGRWHARHSSHGSSGGSYSHASHGSSGGSYGSYGGSAGGSYGGSAGASYGGHGSHGYVTERVISDQGVSREKVEGYRVIDDRPAAGSETIKTPAPAPAAGGDKTSSLRVPADAGMLVVHVPESGKVFINGSETKASGSVRRFLSRGLKAGEKYDFQVRVVADDNGTPAEQVKVVSLSAGEQREVEFAPAQKQTGRTSLTLRVPADAKVWLAGKPTNASGTVRRFETEALKPGERWSGYEVRVVTTEAGTEKVTRKVIDLVGGESMKLALRSDELHADEGKASVEQSAGSSAPVSGVASIR